MAEIKIRKCIAYSGMYVKQGENGGKQKRMGDGGKDMYVLVIAYST